MTSDLLIKFRRQLLAWLQFRLAGGRLPFQRVEETPSLIVDGRLAFPDLVLWINRDSLLAGAMIAIPARVDATFLHEGRLMAGSLGLRQFATWEARAVNIWDTQTTPPQLLKSWPIAATGSLRSDDFALIFEQLLAALKESSVTAALPAQQLPAAYFANLCRQVLRDIEPTLQEAARVTAGDEDTDQRIRQRARDKGWLTLWRLLALLRDDRLPTAVRPEHLDRALGYALTGLDQELRQILAFAPQEIPLAETAAIRLHHLAVRLAQLGWHQDHSRLADSLRLLCIEAARDCGIETALPEPLSGGGELWVNYLPTRLQTATLLVAPWPCLGGLALTGAQPTGMAQDVASLPADCKPRRIVANLFDPQPLSPTGYRRRLTALRHPWPYRRFPLARRAPCWLWDALHLGGLVDADGSLQLALPADWPSATDAELLWTALGSRLALTRLVVHPDGRQTLTLAGQEHAPDSVLVVGADGATRQLPALPDGAPLTAVLDICQGAAAPSSVPIRTRRVSSDLAEQIASTVFRDGLPRFPEQYLRRIDVPALRCYPCPGPLRTDSHFFDRIRLVAADGSSVEAANPADAEALLLASIDGRSRIELPVDPLLTAQLTAAYRADLQRLWQTLLDECRRHHPSRRHAQALARRLWREHGLPTL